MEHAEHALIHSNDIDVNWTLACRLAEDAEEFAWNLQPFSGIDNAQENQDRRGNCEIVFGCLSIFLDEICTCLLSHRRRKPPFTQTPPARTGKALEMSWGTSVQDWCIVSARVKLRHNWNIHPYHESSQHAMPPPPRHPQARDHPYTTESTIQMPPQHQKNTSQT